MSRIRNFVEPFALTRPYAPEMVELEPAMADVHGGVTIVKANETGGLLFLMLAYLNQTMNDKLILLVNGNEGPSATIAEGKESEDTPLRLPAGLLQKGLNRIKIHIERTSGNDELTPELVLYHRTSPPGDSPPVLNLTVSHKVINQAEADKFKVTVTYANLQWYDRIFVSCNGVHHIYQLTPTSVSPLPPVPESVVIDIPKDKLIEGGNDKTFEIKYRVVDYLTNPSGPPTWSDAVFVEVDLDKMSLDPPTLVNATSPIDVLASESGVKVRAELKAAQPNDKATLNIVDGVPGSSFPQVAFNTNQRANFTFSVAFLLAHQGKTIQVSWVLIRDGVPSGESPPLEVVIDKIAVDDPRLPTPNIAGETGQQLIVQDLPTDARVLSDKVPLMQQKHPVWIDFEGVDVDGKPETKEVSAGGLSELADRISLLTPVEWLEARKHGSVLKVICAVNLDGIKDKMKAVPLRVRIYTVSAGEIRPFITGIKDSIQENIPEGGTTADKIVTVSGGANPGQNIQLYDDINSIGPVIKTLQDGTWSHLIEDLTLKSYSFTAKSANGVPSTPPRTFRVIDYFEENFDALPDQALNKQGDKIETPLMTITKLDNYDSASIGAAYNTAPGKIEGKAFRGSNYSGGLYRINFKSSHNRISFWLGINMQGAGVSDGVMYLLNNETKVGQIRLNSTPGASTRLCDLTPTTTFNAATISFLFPGTITMYQLDTFRLYK